MMSYTDTENQVEVNVEEDDDVVIVSYTIFSGSVTINFDISTSLQKYSDGTSCVSDEVLSFARFLNTSDADFDGDDFCIHKKSDVWYFGRENGLSLGFVVKVSMDKESNNNLIERTLGVITTIDAKFSTTFFEELQK